MGPSRFSISSPPYGDDFTDAQISQWLKGEERGYFNISAGAAQTVAEYDSVNRLTLFRHVKGRQFPVCVVLGCAAGHDVYPLAHQVGKFIAIEPTTDYWGAQIGGRPTEWRKPSLRGTIEIPDASVDLVVAINVIHHIPNVSDILMEVTRILRKDGIFLTSETITSMGDWTKPRCGVTANERGIPPVWFCKKLQQCGFSIERRTFHRFGLFVRLCHKFGVLPFRYTGTTWIDIILSTVFSWNQHYYRTGMLQKIAPTDISLVCRKTSGNYASVCDATPISAV